MKRTSSHRRIYLIAALAGAALGVAAAVATAADCAALLPRGAVPASDIYLCPVAGGEPQACRDYRSGERRFRVQFGGGRTPRRVAEIGTHARAAAPADIAVQRCELARPAQVPDAAQFRGTGVCEDEDGRPVPCSLFEHAAAREPRALRYFVYYEPAGGVRRIDAVDAGRNEHAFEAELAFHLGQSLAARGCCRAEARPYVAHAAALFPADPVYRAALLAFAAPLPIHTAAVAPQCVPGDASPNASH
jgi:hypothetical protein